MFSPKLKNNSLSKSKRKNSFTNQELVRSISKMNQQEILDHFELTQFGLTEVEFEERLDKYGKNELDQNRFRWLFEFVRAYFSPFNIILLIISAYNFASYFTYVFGTEESRSIFSLVGALVVLLMVIVSGTMTFVQAFRGYFVTKKLKTIIKNRTNIIRHQSVEVNLEAYQTITKKNHLKLMKLGEELEITQLVPGDLIYLSSGDMLPADVRVIQSNDLFINQSSLTGESLPIEKHADNLVKTENILELDNICFTGTSVISGSALAIVITTGNETYFSSVGKLMDEKRPEGAFLAGIRHVTRVLLVFMLIMVPLIYFIYVGVNAGKIHDPLKDNPWFTGIFFAIALVVALTPEMLPMIVTTNLANGASKMTKQKVVVKRFDAIQSLGAIDVLATDKTGTLTNDKIELIHYSTIDKKPDNQLMKFLYLNSYFQTGLKNPMDRAIIDYVKAQKFAFNKNNFVKVDEIPFDFNRRKLTIVFENDQERTMVTKGSVEEILASCSQVYYEGRIIKLNAALKRQITAHYQTANEKGERVLGIAYKPVQNNQERFTDSDETDLIFYGFASFLDTPKPSAAKMIKLLKKYGVDLKILTGDNEQVTRAICKMVGLDIKGLVSGQDLENATEVELKQIVERANIFVKLSPLQKVRVLEVLKSNNHSVGYVGDGINDAPVLYQADVAISVNNAADIAKEASDIILLEKDLGVLEKGIIQGRTVFGNILKYMKITIASQFGNAFSMVVATASFGNMLLAMSPIQTLFQNLIYDFSQLIIAIDYVDDTFIAKPQRWTTKDLVPFTLVNGPVSSIFDLINYGVSGFGFGIFKGIQAAQAVGDSATVAQLTGEFQATAFLIGLVTQATIVHVLRTEKVPLVQSRSPWIIYLITGLIVALTYTIVFTPSIAGLLEMNSPRMIFLPISMAIVVSYWMTAQVFKVGYKKVFHKWL